MRLVVVLTNGGHGVLKEVCEGVFRDLLNRLFGLTVVVDRRVLDRDTIEGIDERVGLDFVFRGQVFVRVVFDVQKDLAACVHVHDGVLKRAITNVESANFPATRGDVAAELSRSDKRLHHGIAASFAAKIPGFFENVESVQSGSFVCEEDA